MGKRTICPQCGEPLIFTNLGNGTIDVFCEECGWPDDNLPPNPQCVICHEPGVGICGSTWRCEKHWIDRGEDKMMGVLDTPASPPAKMYLDIEREKG